MNIRPSPLPWARQPDTDSWSLGAWTSWTTLRGLGYSRCRYTVTIYLWAEPILSPINPNFNRLCLIIADIPWLEVQSLPRSRRKQGAAFQMQNIILRSRHDLLKTPRPVCDSSIGAGESFWKAPLVSIGTSRYYWVYWGVRSSVAESPHHTSCVCRAFSCSKFSSKLRNWGLSGVRTTKPTWYMLHQNPERLLRSMPLNWPLTLKETTLHSRQVDSEELPQPDRHLDVHSDYPHAGNRLLVNVTSRVHSPWSYWYNRSV